MTLPAKKKVHIQRGPPPKRLKLIHKRVSKRRRKKIRKKGKKRV